MTPWVRPTVKETSFPFIEPQVTHVLLADTSVVKSVMLGEVSDLPVADHLCWLASKKVMQECQSDSRIQPIHAYWPPYIIDCSHFIQGFTHSRCNTMFEMMYQAILKGKCINGKIYPPYGEFEDSDDYPNTCNHFTIYLEALILSKYVHLALKRQVRVSLVTFDSKQGKMVELCNKDIAARQFLKLLVEEKDISDLHLVSAPSRRLPNL